jgi:hypothetical protein
MRENTVKLFSTYTRVTRTHSFTRVTRTHSFTRVTRTHTYICLDIAGGTCHVWLRGLVRGCVMLGQGQCGVLLGVGCAGTYGWVCRV